MKQTSINGQPEPGGLQSRFTRFGTFLMALLGMCLVLCPGRAAELNSFQAGEGSWQMGTLAVGNITAGSTPAIVVPYKDSSGQWYLDAFTAAGARLPGFPFAGGTNEINASPTLYDLDGDGLDEIIFTCGTRVIALRGDGSLFWATGVDRFNYVPDGGYMTVTNGFYWSNGGAFIPNLPATAVFSSQVSSPIIADVNGNGTKEVITAWKIKPDNTSSYQDYNPFIRPIWGFGDWGTVGETWSGGVVFFDAATGTKDFVYHFHHLVESGVALGHADTNKALEVYVLNDSDSLVAFDKSRPFGVFGKGMLHGQFGKNLRLQSGSYQLGVDVYCADIDGDGLSEVLVPTTQLQPLWQPSETVLDHDGAVLWRQWKQPVNFPLDQWQNNACMIPINPDHDNHIDVLSFTHSFEIGFRFWNGVDLVDHPGWPKSFYPYLPTPPVVGDVDGDGQEEIIIGTYNPAANPSDGYLYVFAFDGTLKYSVAVPGGLKHIPTITDAYGDGRLDVVYRSLAGRIYIQNFGSTSPGTVSWATHRGNRHRDGNLGVSLYPPGTPLITQNESGYRRATFSWGGLATNSASAWQIFRADQPEGPFTHLATLIAGATTFTDFSVKPGCQYIYEVAADYGTNSVHSPPFAILSGLGGNLVTNGGFEENDDSHWDKWFTGSIDWTNMIPSTNVVFQGRKSMEIKLVNETNNGSICQNNQYGIPDGSIQVTPGQLYSFGCWFKSGGISQPSQHWLEWTSTKTGNDTNNRPLRPWPYYTTPSFNIDTNATEWTYANRTFVLPAGFPNVELTHRYTIAAPGSGSIYIDNVFFRALPSPDSTNWTELIPFGALWKYSVNPPSPGWSSAEFDDSQWPIARAKFGAGGGPTNIATTLVAQKPSYYFRTAFVAPESPCDQLLLSATCTDGGAESLVIFLNGSRLVATGINPVTDQGNDVQYYDLTPFLDLLHPGVNTIAVILNNVSQPTWDDVAFDLSLKTVIYAPVTALINTFAAPAGITAGIPEVNLGVVAPTNSVWRVESSDAIANSPWQLIELITNNAPNGVVVKDVGQNGRLPPGQVPARFYRLSPK